MDRSRLIVLVIAGFAAIAAALLVRALFGAGTTRPMPVAAANPGATVSVLVAATDLQPGVRLAPGMVKWQSWPKSAIAADFITAEKPQDASQIIAGTVARAPIVSGEPITSSKIVHSDSAGFMAAQLPDGKRATSIPISDQTGASGFILPNDRVDVLLSVGKNGSGETRTILTDVRVLAIGQTYKQGRDEKVITGKTATLEVSPLGAEKLASAAISGTLSLALRPLGDNPAAEDDNAGGMTVIRYGVGQIGGQE